MSSESEFKSWIIQKDGERYEKERPSPPKTPFWRGIPL